MNHASLASKYRPQTFAEVTGQETVKAILSRAAAENRVAPTYLLSGTRGVGKTTIARIFAKALNCEHAPAAEPCNQCRACRSITQGNFVDVVEIDGASNRGIDDARRLRESIGYAPMEGRYKVFIIDEAHMLTKESFNALLKTLEEPPPQVTFIMATTEPQKFPVTIISRCQHFVFSALPESELIRHLQNILQKENVSYEESAVRLIARRAAGSVRDGMSLLGQTLALGGETLTEASAREVLGLVGQELYGQILSAIQAQDCVRVATLTRELLRTGADLGFFLRELALMWRNLFLLRQAGNAALPLIDLSDDEKKPLSELAQKFELPAIHAAWQRTLEGQRQVLT
ncbi:MAG: DNA polymerase III subunit gamma/tau, partial [Desulfovibrionaceae bacterium]|nr:DNA polymerase III subunit gamma/tau [Desulfovibrionaceae bacterium]